MFDTNLSGKTAFVCGSSQGIGRACAEQLAMLGAHVVLLARNAERLAQVRDALPVHAGQKHTYIAVDFTDLTALETAVKSWLAEGKTAHILVNNTGGPAAGPISSATQPEFLAAFQNHLLANHLLATLLLPGMKNAAYGRIINIISTSVKVPLKGLGVSNTIRAAVANWAKTLSNEVAAFGVTVNNVLPGATKTVRLESILAGKAAKTGHNLEAVEAEMLAEIPAARFGEAKEIAAAVAFLATPSAAYINGINVPVDGGRTGSL
jgi:3-oxoacyl-[acyl-carrier protein] reductase